MTAERPVEKSSAVADASADRLTDLFWQAEKLPSIGEWRVRFETTVRTLMRVRSLPRLEAEKAAYQNVLVEFLNGEMPTLATRACLEKPLMEKPLVQIQSVAAAAPTPPPTPATTPQTRPSSWQS